MRNQVRELLTNYGKIDVLWFDFSYSGRVPEKGKEWMKGKGKDDWEAEKLIALARELQPGIMIDNRTEIEQDLWTPEQYQPLEWVRHKETGELVVWEACQTFSGSWGYYRDETTWKSPEMLIRMLVNTVALGGNLLMNVGPTSRGYFDARAEAALKVYADWMKYNSRSIYGCTMAEPEYLACVPTDCRLTQSEDGQAPVHSPVRLSVRAPAAARHGGQGGLRAVPARWQRAALHRGQGQPLQRGRDPGRRPAGH